MSPPSTVGRHALSTRFTARVRVACLSTPDKAALQEIYTSVVTQVGACCVDVCFVLCPVPHLLPAL